MNKMVQLGITAALVAITSVLAIELLENGTIRTGEMTVLATRFVIVLVLAFAGLFAVGAQGAGVSTPSATSSRETGAVKWFNVKKGYGFITRDSGDDVFVHYRNIDGGGRRTIADGQRVSFVVATGDKGLQAEEVARLEE